MRQARFTVAAMAGLTAVMLAGAPSARAQVPAATPASAEPPEAAAAGTGASEAPAASTGALPAPAAAAAPKAIIDTEGSARREAEFRKTPWLPQVFVHQWLYREPAVSMPDISVDRETARLSVAEAVHEALQHNPSVAAQRLTPLRQQEDIRRAEAIFDPTFTLAFNKERHKEPNSSALSGVRVNIREDLNFNAGLRKKLRTGGDFAVDFTNNRLESNARFQGLIPQYRPELVFSLTQPLLRNFGINFAYLLVDITTLTSEAARYTYRAQLADFVKQVIEAYWAVVFARENLVVQRQSLDLASETLRENSERVRVGLLAPVAVKEAESEAALREEQVIVAQNTLDIAQYTLRKLVYLHDGDTFVPRRIEPVENPRTSPVRVEAEQALATALENRPEIYAQNLDVRSKNLTARVRENQLLPRVDFVGNFGLNGLSGDAVTVTVDGQPAQTPFDGPYAEALDRLSSKEFYSYLAGVEVEIPLGNAAAKADYAQAKIDVAQSELNRRELLASITLEVAKAVNDVVTNMKRIESARVARELAEENLRNQQKRLQVGMATTKDILDFQDQLTTARGLEVQAATDYNVSLAELARAQGTLLDQYSVVIEVPGERFVPWWARF